LSTQSGARRITFSKNQRLGYPHNPSIPREGHFDNPTLRLSLRLNPGLKIDLESAPAVCMAHKFLYNLHILPVRHQHGGAMPERVPTDALPNPGADSCKANDASQ
jgi:hypothetical protein